MLLLGRSKLRRAAAPMPRISSRLQSSTVPLRVTASLLLAAGIVLSGCIAYTPSYGYSYPSYGYGYPAYGYGYPAYGYGYPAYGYGYPAYSSFSFSYWGGWHDWDEGHWGHGGHMH